MKRVFLVLSFVCLSAPAFAQDSQYLNLFPNQRAAHQAKMDSNADQMNAQAYDYVERLYETGAEGGGFTSISQSVQQPRVPEADLDAYINGTRSLTDGDAHAPLDAPPLPTNAR